MTSHPSELPITEIAELDAPVLITPDNTTNNLENPKNSDEEEGGGLMDKVYMFLDTDPDTGDTDDDSKPWIEGEISPPHPEYVFCPSPHHKPILHLFTKYFCQHPLFPEHHGSSLDAAAIHRQGVSEMYQFCYQ